MDPIFVIIMLPGLLLAMYAQFKLNPAPPDPLQAKIFMIMPIAMTVMFAFFPSGLVLYWLTNTLLSILQQWNINRRIEAAHWEAVADSRLGLSLGDAFSLGSHAYTVVGLTRGAVDPAGNLYVCGYTSSSNFPVQNLAGAYNQANPFILGLLAGPQAVGFYGGAERVVRDGGLTPIPRVAWRAGSTASARRPAGARRSRTQGGGRRRGRRHDAKDVERAHPQRAARRGREAQDHDGIDQPPDHGRRRSADAVVCRTARRPAPSRDARG